MWLGANYSFAAAIGGVKPDVDVAAIGKMTSKDDIVGTLAGSYAAMHKAIGTLTVANAFRGDQQDAGAGIADARDAGCVYCWALLRPLRADGGVPADEWIGSGRWWSGEVI